MHMNTLRHNTLPILIMSTALLSYGCASKSTVITMTGTTVGLEASPGDITNGQSPSVLFGYKRAEVAIVPVPQDDPGATDEKSNSLQTPGDATPQDLPELKNSGATKPSTDSTPRKTDAFSVLASFNLALNWFGPAKIEQFIATGHAARQIQTSILGGMASATDRWAVLYKKLHSTDPHSGCWNEIKSWIAKNAPAVSEKDFIEQPMHADKRAKASEDQTVKGSCLVQFKAQ
jgi:hypothetical protein